MPRRFLSVPLEAGFGEVDVVLDAAEDFVVDGVFVAQGDDGFAFRFEGFTGELFEVAREQAADAFFVGGLPAQLPDAIRVIGAKTFDALGPGLARRYLSRSWVCLSF